MTKLTLEQQELLFANDCKLINLRYEYHGYTGTEKWAIVTELAEEELWVKYPDVIRRYTPFILLSMAQGEVIDESYRNNDKYEKRAKRTIDVYGYEDDISEQFHRELITPFVDPFEQAEEERIEEEKEQLHFDYIFHASGTGATQAGLVCGKLLEKIPSERQIVGISIARTEERGREVVKESIRDYLGEQFETLYRECDLIFTDHYRCDGYGNYSADVTQTIDRMMREEGIPMDTTYVGKAFTGMLQYLKDNRITDQKILFIHTGGTPLFFDRLGKEENVE